MARSGGKETVPLFDVSLYPPMALVGYLVVVSLSFLVYGLFTGVADTTFTYTFLGLIILLLYCLYFVLSQRIWRARFYERTFSLDERRRHRDIDYGQISEVSARRMVFSLVSAVEITLKNERTRFSIPGNPRNSSLEIDLRAWLLRKTEAPRLPDR